MAQVRRFASLIILAAACTVAENRGGGIGTLVISTAGDPNSLVPPLVASVQGRQVTDLIYERLASLGDSLHTNGDAGFTPALADSWSWASDSLSIAFHLNSRARWHDGQPVRSSDVRFTFNSYRDPALASRIGSLVDHVDSVSAPDSLTAVVWFHARAPEQFYEATDGIIIMPEHLWKTIPPSQWSASPQAMKPVGSGKFRFESWNHGSSLSLVADTTNYRGRPKLDRVVWSIAPDFNTALTRFLGGETDLFEGLRADDFADVGKKPDLRIVATPGTAYVFLQFNLRDPKKPARPHPVFGDRDVRRALTMAVDRASLVKNVYGTMALPALGPTQRAFPSTDPDIAQIPYDLAGAKLLLDSLGWRSDPSSGVRKRGAQKLAFTIVVPSSSKPRVRLAVLLQEQLRQAGADVAVEQADFPAFMTRSRKRDFDALLNGLRSQPSPSSLRDDWTSVGTAPGANNTGSYINPLFDVTVDSALGAY